MRRLQGESGTMQRADWLLHVLWRVVPHAPATRPQLESDFRHAKNQSYDGENAQWLPENLSSEARPCGASDGLETAYFVLLC